MQRRFHNPTDSMNPRFPRVSLCIAGNATRYCRPAPKAQLRNERAEMAEARELLQVTKHHFNTAPFAVRMLYFARSVFRLIGI